jgi:hypothetical protein
MWRRDPVTLDPEIARELEALEAALAGDPAADPQLLALVEDVRAARPVPDEPFAARLDERVAEGFPREAPHGLLGGPRTWLRGASGSRARLIPALGVAATLLVGITAAALLTGGGTTSNPASRTLRQPAVIPTRTASGSSGGATELGAPLAQDQAAPGGSKAAAPTLQSTSSAGVTPVPAPGAPTPSFGRKVEKSAQLTLTTSSGDVQTVSDGVVQTTQAVGGYVQRSQVSTSDGAGEASFTLRLPASRLDDALHRLSRLAHVGSLTQGANDITSGFVSATSRLSDARAERRALLRALAKARTANEIASLRARIRFNASEIANLKGQLASLRRRANFATVDVTVSGTGTKRGAGGAWTPGDALRDAGRVIEVVAGATLVAGAALAPAALAALLVALAMRATRRRRRESALDSAA